ncbi:hypothetical protein V425_00215 [Lactococcus lactis RTB018]|nr:hypothetical protein V425_00215 [Lactococcus lactis RTB018]
MSVYYGSIEAGGTKFVLAIADEHFNIIKNSNLLLLRHKKL